MAPDGRELSGLTRETRLAIIRQPENYSGTVGDTVTFSIQARGANLSYQWQVSTDGGAEWYDSTAEGYNTPAISMPLAEHNPGYLYRCRVTDGGGNVAYSTPGQIILLTETWSFIYNADGLRTGRSNGSTTYSYVYNGSSLSQMTVNGNTLYFAYDASGTPLSVTYNGTSYYYATNLQGDVTAILDGSGTAVVQYTYDAWGNILSATGSLSGTLGICNPLRYRGYVYDTETRLYYLQSRYYDPTLGRFISADAFASTGQGILGNNMFAYCRNNPVIRKDASGTDDVRVTGNEEYGNPLNDYYGNGGAAGGGSGYGVDFSVAQYSSLYTGGIHNNGYGTYYTCSNPFGGTVNSNVTDQLQKCADTANSIVSGNGAVAGTKKHVVFANEVNKLGNSSLRTEISFLDGMEVSHGTKGSIRFDVIQVGPSGDPIYAWDLKTGSAALTKGRIAQMQSKSGLNIPIEMIK